VLVQDISTIARAGGDCFHGSTYFDRAMPLPCNTHRQNTAFATRARGSHSGAGQLKLVYRFSKTREKAVMAIVLLTSAALAASIHLALLARRPALKTVRQRAD
jgi:hypothetical protein